MFLVSDTSASRESRIQSLLVDEPPLAAILAVIHFEWTIRRAIIALGTSPNVIIREKLEGCHGHKKYKQLWQEEVYPQANKRLTEIIKDWQGLQKSFQLRHKLVHGVKSCGKSEYANTRVLWALNAAKDIREFCYVHKTIDLDSRLPVRRRLMHSRKPLDD